MPIRATFSGHVVGNSRISNCKVTMIRPNRCCRVEHRSMSPRIKESAPYKTACVLSGFVQKDGHRRAERSLMNSPLRRVRTQDQGSANVADFCVSDIRLSMSGGPCSKTHMKCCTQASGAAQEHYTYGSYLRTLESNRGPSL